MSARLTTIVAVIGMSALLLLYIWAAGWQAVVMLGSGQPVVVAMGVALLVFPFVGLWALFRELRFGWQSSQLATQLSRDGQWPEMDVVLLPSGRVDRRASQVDVSVFTAEVEKHPASWQAWFRLGLAYDASGDRRRAREAIRSAISLSRPPALD